MQEILYIIVPCYNEEEVLEDSSKKLLDVLNQMIDCKLISNESKIVFVNDGSKDRTWEIISNLTQKDEKFKGVSLSHNRGHQNALLAGYTYSVDKADMMITIDADIQDDINVMKDFVNNYYAGCDVVYGVRTSRKKDSFFKRSTAQGFYKFMKRMGVEVVYNHADYRLTSKKATKAILEFDESNLFLRGIVPLIGFKSAKVGYERSKRLAGKSKYPLRKMLSFAWDGITSFSTKPLNMLLTFGFLFSFIGIGFDIYFLVDYFISNNIVRHPLLVILFSMLFSLGVILLGIGLVGQYVGKTYIETKKRPRFFIDETK